MATPISGRHWPSPGRWLSQAFQLPPPASPAQTPRRKSHLSGEQSPAKPSTPDPGLSRGTPDTGLSQGRLGSPPGLAHSEGPSPPGIGNPPPPASGIGKAAAARRSRGAWRHRDKTWHVLDEAARPGAGRRPGMAGSCLHRDPRRLLFFSPPDPQTLPYNLTQG